MKKLFFRHFWWLGLGIIIMLIVFGIIINDAHKKDENKFDDKKGVGQEQNIALAENLPVCPADTSGLFTKPFMDGDKPDMIIPLGHSSLSGHVVPTDHVYPNNNIFVPDMPIYAPGRITLIWIENKQMYYKETNEKVAPDYQLNFAPCRGINLTFIHLTKLSDKLSSAITEKVDSNCDDSQKMDFGTRNGAPIYYKTCHPKFVQVTLEPGELIGYFGFTDRVGKSQVNFDIGIYDFNKPALAFVNPDRYYNETNHTACFTDYYVPELRAKYEAKFGSNDNNNGQLSFLQRTTEPVCGQVMYDIAGTAAGSWFKNPLEKWNITDQDALALIHDNLKPELVKMSMAGITSYTFTPTHSGTTNREFSEVNADNKIYYYQSDDNFDGSYLDKDGKTITKEGFKYLLQLVDDIHLKAEVQSGTCDTNESFKNPYIFER
ncbi:MAG: hypothetical protein WC863_01910 [Patescibacteria group bacterium]